MAPHGLEKEAGKRRLSVLQWETVFVACARSHSSLVVSQADTPAVPSPESGVARAGAPGACLVLATGVIRTGGRVMSNVLFVGLVGCLAGQDGPLPCMLSQCCHSFLRLCPPPAPWGDTLTGFPPSSCVLMGAGPQPRAWFSAGSVSMWRGFAGWAFRFGLRVQFPSLGPANGLLAWPAS